MKKQLLILTILLFCLVVSTAPAQSGGTFAITQSVIASGGGQNSAGGTFALDGTIGQSAAGTRMAGGNFAQTGGFWAVPPNLAPTAAGVSVGGRVLTAEGRGITNVVIQITDSRGQTYITRTSAFGYFQFDEIEVGQTCILQIFGKRFVFANPLRVLNVNEAINNADFTAEPQ